MSQVLEPPISAGTGSSNTGSSNTVLEVRNLHVSFHTDEGVVRAVRGASFAVEAGKTLGIVGESGCGKSVAARAMLQLIQTPGRIDQGEVWLHKSDASDDASIDLAALPPYSTTLRQVRGGDIAMIFQEPMTAMSPVHTIGQQIIEAVRLHEAMPRKQARHKAIDLLERVGLPEPSKRIDAYTFELSGGQRQRAMIAMAIASSPSVLIADEPTTALDVTTQARILDLLRDLQQRNGMALILITHDLGVVADMADDVAVMYLGAVVEHAPVNDLFANPKHPYTKALLASVPTVSVGNHTLLPVIAGNVPSGTHVPQGCAFAPRCVEAVAGFCEQVAPRDITLGERRVICHLADPTQTISREPRARTSSSEQGLEHSATSATTASDEVCLAIENVSITYPLYSRGLLRRKIGTTAAVDEVSLTLHAGEALGLVGESGCGKTSLAHALVRLTPVTSGTVTLHHEATVTNIVRAKGESLRQVRKAVRMVFQDPYGSLDPRLPVADVIGEPMALLNRMPAKARKHETAQLLAAVGLDKRAMGRYVHAFSGGQRQRISIARALATNPRLLVADEAVSALDVSVQAQVLNLLKTLKTERQLTMLFISHDLAVVSSLCERVAVMYAGRIVEVAAKDNLFSSPKHPYTESLLNAILPPDPTVKRAPQASQELTTTPAPSSACAFAPRCPYATEQCRVQRPTLREVGGHQVACHHAEQLHLTSHHLLSRTRSSSTAS